MSNKILIPVVVIFSILTIGVGSLIQLNKNPQKVVINPNQSSQIVSSYKPQIVSSSTLVQSQNSSSVISSHIKVVDSNIEGFVKSESKIINKSPSEITYDENNIAYLSSEKSNLPKSVTQFLDCTTKFLNGHNGAFVIENDEEVYKCPPKIETLGCSFNISYLIMPSKPAPIMYDKQNKLIYPLDTDWKEFNKRYKTGWTCDLMYPKGVQNDGGFTCILTKSADYNFQYSTFETTNNIPYCYAIPKTLL
jgi:hypothetical protein